jgi:hypothetical protein
VGVGRLEFDMEEVEFVVRGNCDVNLELLSGNM